MTDSRWFDPEIDDIFEGDPHLAELAHSVRAARPEPPLDPRFQGVLRAQLMREAPAALGSPAKPAKPANPARQRTFSPRALRTRRVAWWRSTPSAWGAAGLGAALVAAAVLTVLRTPVNDHQVTAMSPVAQLHAVSPNNVITVAFDQPMNEAAVVAGLHIRPATEVTTAWQGNNLVITPTHHLAGNTPYTVTIDHKATKASSGQLAASDIRISFGTAPTPPPAPTVAKLATQSLAPVSDGAQLISAGDGTVIATSSTAVPGGAQTSPSATTSATPSTSPSASASAVPTLSGELVSMSAGGGVTDLGPAASSAALAPSGLRLVAAVPTSSGTTIELVPVDGSRRSVLATLAAPVLATGWLNNSTALVAETDRIVTVDLQGHVSTLTTLPAATTRVVFSATGGQAFAGSATADGALVDLATLQTRPLPGSREIAAFSGDGAVVAWVDATANTTRLLTSPVSRATAAAIPLDHPRDAIAAIALDNSGNHLAVVDQPASGDGGLDVLTLPSGTVIATRPQATAPAFSAQGNRLAFASGGLVDVATLPGVQQGTAVNTLPDGAASALKAFVDAQVRADAATLQNLSAPGLDATGSTPLGLTRAYVISAVSNPDGTVSATARLIADPSAGHAAASFADETLGLSPKEGGGSYLVSSLNAGPLTDEPIGPHVVSIAPIAGPSLVLRVSFDSDLRAATVAGAITVSTRGGATLAATTVYDPNTRTATVTVPLPANTVVTLNVNTTLTDVDGQSLASSFTTVSGG
jgi:Bacterial Ig-like domain